MKSHAKKRSNYSWLILLVVFIIMLVLNYWTPLIYDDYRYHLETKGFSTIIGDEYHQWLTWTGRSVAHAMLRFWLRFPKIVFDVVCAGSFTYLVYTIGKMAKGTRQLGGWAKTLLYSFIFGMLWLFSPDFAQVYLWKSGAANYLLVMVIMLSYLLVFHQAVINKRSPRLSWLLAIVMLIFGVLAGWSNENTSGGVLLISLGYILLHCCYQHRRLQTWMVTGVIGNIVGMAVMASAPGNAIRAAYFPDRNNLSLIWKMINGMTQVFPSMMDNGKLLMVIAAALLIFAVWQNGMRLEEWISTLFLIGGLATIVVLVIAPAGIYWSRSYFGGVFFIIVSIVMSMVNILDHSDSTVRLAVSLVSAYVAVCTMGTFFSAVSDSYQNHVSYNHQLNALVKQRDAGKANVVVPALTYKAQTPYAMTDKDDMSPDQKNYRNKQTAAYWGVKSVRSVEKK